MKYLLILSLLITGCHPIVLEPIAPSVKIAHDKSVSVQRSAKKTHDVSIDVQQSNNAIGKEIDSATNNALILYNKGYATKQELNDQWKELCKIQAHSMVLQSKSNELTQSALDTSDLSLQAATGVSDLYKQATILDTNVVKIKKKEAKEAKYAVTGKAVTWFVYIGIAAGIVLAILLVLSQISKIAAKRAIMV